MRVVIAIVSGFIYSVVIVIGGIFTVVGILIAYVAHMILHAAIQTGIEIMGLQEPENLDRMVWVFLFLALWVVMTIQQLQENPAPVQDEKPKRRES